MLFIYMLSVSTPVYADDEKAVTEDTAKVEAGETDKKKEDEEDEEDEEEGYAGSDTLCRGICEAPPGTIILVVTARESVPEGIDYEVELLEQAGRDVFVLDVSRPQDSGECIVIRLVQIQPFVRDRQRFRRFDRFSHGALRLGHPQLLVFLGKMIPYFNRIK